MYDLLAHIYIWDQVIKYYVVFIHLLCTGNALNNFKNRLTLLSHIHVHKIYIRRRVGNCMATLASYVCALNYDDA